MEIELKVLYINEDEAKLEDLGVHKFDYDESRKIIMTFYNIDNISPDGEDDNYSVITSGGVQFVCEIKYEDLKEMIKKAKS